MLFSQLHRHARVQSDVCTLKYSSLMFYIQFKEKSNRNCSNVLTLQSLLLGFRSCCCCCCCPNEYILCVHLQQRISTNPFITVPLKCAPLLASHEKHCLSQTAERSPSKQVTLDTNVDTIEKMNYAHLFEFIMIKASDQCEWSSSKNIASVLSGEAGKHVQ